MATKTDAVRGARTPVRNPQLNSAHVAYASLVFFSVFGANFWRNLLTWWGWGAIVAVLFTIGIVWAARSGTFRLVTKLPIALSAFIVYALASSLWSNWAPETVLGWLAMSVAIVIAFILAALTTWDEILVALSLSLRWIVGLSIVFELFVSLVLRHAVLPAYITWTSVEEAPLMLMWSRNLLFVDGKIQGIVGNSTLLAAIALLALIVVAVQAACRRLGRRPAIVWLALIVLVLVLTRSATIIVAAVTVLAVLAIVLLRRVIPNGPAVAGFYAGVIVVIAAALVGVVTFWTQILALLGKNGDLTGRVEIWNAVLGLVQERPVFGWGWLGYWPPWVEPLDHLVTRWGVVQLHAHNAWIDLLMQVGIVGAIIFALFVLRTIGRGYTAAVKPVVIPGTRHVGFGALSLLPILLLAYLVVQSLTESRLIVEEGLLLLALVGIKLKLDPFLRDLPGEPVRER